MPNYEGIIEILQITNHGDHFKEFPTPSGRMVRYPGSQQLSIWLPEDAIQNYLKYCIYDLINNRTLEEGSVEQKVTGRILMIWNTIEWKPSDYHLAIDHIKGYQHHIRFRKLLDNEGISSDQIVEMPIATTLQPSLIKNINLINNQSESKIETASTESYQDGFGNKILNMDQVIREKNLNLLQNTFKEIFLNNNQKNYVEYNDQGRSGEILYHENDLCIKFYYELGGQNCKLWIRIPTESNWLMETKIPVGRRREILLSIASSVIRDQASTWRFEIHDDEILFFQS
ncbi:MAG: hypothetical protein IT267_06785 [Saprospiraceae bacterium]|nr:hypothetical protein [Saprospiraceae bacterium]